MNNDTDSEFVLAIRPCKVYFRFLIPVCTFIKTPVCTFDIFKISYQCGRGIVTGLRMASRSCTSHGTCTAYSSALEKDHGTYIAAA